MQIFLQFVRRFGFINGFLLFLKIRRRKVNHLSVDGFKQSISLRPDSVDINIFRHIIINEDYKINFAFKPDIIIDGGAYIGLSTIYFANRYPQANIIAIEPDPQNFELLSKNVITYSNVIPIQSGLWYEDTYIKNEKMGNHHCGNIIRTTEKSDPAAIKSICIDSIMDQYKLKAIDILKLDVEGAERELFSHNCDNWLSKTRSIIIEIHDKKNSGSSKAVFEAVIKHGFIFWGVKGENLIFAK